MDFKVKAKEILKAEMKRQGISVPELAGRLSEIGAPEAVQSLGVKISRGTFQLSFFIQCLTAMGVEKAEFEVPSRVEAKKDKPAINRNRPRALLEDQERQRIVHAAKANASSTRKMLDSDAARIAEVSPSPDIQNEDSPG
jgi:hypothetical protein